MKVKAFLLCKVLISPSANLSINVVLCKTIIFYLYFLAFLIIELVTRRKKCQNRYVKRLFVQ